MRPLSEGLLRQGWTEQEWCAVASRGSSPLAGMYWERVAELRTSRFLSESESPLSRSCLHCAVEGQKVTGRQSYPQDGNLIDKPVGQHPEVYNQRSEDVRQSCGWATPEPQPWIVSAVSLRLGVFSSLRGLGFLRMPSSPVASPAGVTAVVSSPVVRARDKNCKCRHTLEKFPLTAGTTTNHQLLFAFLPKCSSSSQNLF